MVNDWFSLTVVPNRIPRRADGSKVSVAAIHRWASKGIRGVKLESIKVGKTRCTSNDALKRFFQAIAEPRPAPPPPAPRRLESVNRRLADLGFLSESPRLFHRRGGAFLLISKSGVRSTPHCRKVTAHESRVTSV